LEEIRKDILSNSVKPLSDEWQRRANPSLKLRIASKPNLSVQIEREGMPAEALA